jgi:hypothetical protein
VELQVAALIAPVPDALAVAVLPAAVAPGEVIGCFHFDENVSRVGGVLLHLRRSVGHHTINSVS